jgi:hypothetical protein
MGLDTLTPDEREVVRRCLQAVAEGPFISDGDFPLLIGLSRDEAADVAAKWPAWNESEEAVHLALNNSMNSLLIWFGWQEEDPQAGEVLLRQWTGESADEIERIFGKWRGDP